MAWQREMIEVHHEPPEIVAEFGRTTEKCYFCPAPTRYWDRSKKFSVCTECAQSHDQSELVRKSPGYQESTAANSLKNMDQVSA